MLGKIYTKAGEENFIANIIKNSLAVDGPKYVILRMAINKSFRLEYKSLDNPCYANFILYDGFSSGGGEYNMSQVTGSGKESKDYTDILRAAFMLRHKSENLDFSDDAIFISVIEKYIHRGLYELNNLYKSKDDFYQFLIDEFSVTIEPKIIPAEESISERLDEDKIREYFTSAGIKAEILSSDHALRHDVFKIRFKDMKDYARVENEVDDYKVKFGLYSDASTQYAGEQMSLIYICLDLKVSGKNLMQMILVSIYLAIQKATLCPLIAVAISKMRHFSLIYHSTCLSVVLAVAASPCFYIRSLRR